MLLLDGFAGRNQQDRRVEVAQNTEMGRASFFCLPRCVHKLCLPPCVLTVILHVVAFIHFSFSHEIRSLSSRFVLSPQDVIQAIKETAFVTSDYPVILSFENHCRYVSNK